MKNFAKLWLYSLLFLFITLLIPFSVRAEVIRSFHTSIVLEKNAQILVTEDIKYDFGVLNKHGIYRDIHTVITNDQGKKYKLELKVQSVQDETGESYNYTTSQEGEDLRIKIGDANSYVTGLKNYLIAYQVKGAVRYFSDHDELYWNMTGDKWDYPIESASFEVTVPGEIPSEQIKSICFTGGYGSKDTYCETTKDGTVIRGKTTTPLSAKQGFTASVSIPPEYIAHLEAKPVVNFTDTLIGKMVMFLLGILLFIWYVGLPFGIPIYWYLNGRDPKSLTGEVRAWFDPPQDQSGRPLTPTETGLLVDEKADMKDVFAGIIDLARRGYLKIVEKKKGDFYFTRETGKSEKKDSLQAFESELFNGIFKGEKTEVRLKDAKLVTSIEKVQNMLYDGMTKNGFFPSNPQTVRTIWYVVAGLALFTGNFFLAIVSFIFAGIMPKKTVYGAGQANVGKSLKNFLSTQERQLEFQAQNQMFFEKLLPYAIAFGVEKVWANRFKDIDLRNPDWYQGYDNRAFSAAYLVNSMNSSFSTFRSSATPVRSTTGHSSGFGGGGFSGGGGGGGGGGSW